VMLVAADPVGSGLVASLARPGGNVTGVSINSTDLGAKRLALLKEIVPQLNVIGVVWNAANPSAQLVFEQTRAAASPIGVQVEAISVKTRDEIDGALATALHGRIGALILIEDPFTLSERKRLADFALRNRLPLLSGLRQFADAGALISYGPSLAHQLRRSAVYVDRILKGAKPAELPVEQPTNYEMVINRRTAKLIGIDVPRSVLVRADEVID
jgi:ABC-type uncharacterized transport system substrate-binding protein